MAIVRFLTSKDILLGLVYIAFGAFYGIYTVLDLPIGSPLNMGPGFFPLSLSILLIVIGIAVLVPNISRYRERPFGEVNWRAVIAILASVLVFTVLARGAGMVIASAATVLVASLASRFATVRGLAITTVILSAFCTLVFIYGLKLPIGLLGTWFQ